jgi:hypothetical protein
MASEVVEALACCCWTSVLGLDAVELRSLAGCGGDWVELFGTGDAGPNEDEVLLLLEVELLLLLEVKSELLLGLWVRLFPDAFRFEPTRLRKREGIGLCLAPSTLHMPRDKRGRHTQAQTGTREKQKKGKAGRQGRRRGVQTGKRASAARRGKKDRVVGPGCDQRTAA